MSNINNIDYKKKYLKYKKKYLQKKNLYLSGGSDDTINKVNILQPNDLLTVYTYEDEYKLASTPDINPSSLIRLTNILISKFNEYIKNYELWLKNYKPTNLIVEFMGLFNTKKEQEYRNNSRMGINIETIKEEYFKNAGLTLINTVIDITQTQINNLTSVLSYIADIKKIIINFPNTTDTTDTNLTEYIKFYKKLYTNLNTENYSSDYSQTVGRKNETYIELAIPRFYVIPIDGFNPTEIINNMENLIKIDSSLNSKLTPIKKQYTNKLKIIYTEIEKLDIDIYINISRIFLYINDDDNITNDDAKNQFHICTYINALEELHVPNKTALEMNLPKLKTIVERMNKITSNN